MTRLDEKCPDVLRRPMSADAAVWQQQWLRLQLIIRGLRVTRWDAKTWPTAKAE